MEVFLDFFFPKQNSIFFLFESLLCKALILSYLIFYFFENEKRMKLMQDHITSKDAKHKVKSLTFNNNLVSQ